MNLNGNKCLDLELRPGWVDCGNHEADVLGRAGGMHPGALAPCCFPRLLTSSAVLSLAQSRCFALKECLEVEVKGTKASFFFFLAGEGVHAAPQYTVSDPRKARVRAYPSSWLNQQLLLSLSADLR